MVGFGEAAWWFLVDRRHDDFRPFARQAVGWALVGLLIYLVFFVYLRAIWMAIRSPRPVATPESRAFFRVSLGRAALVLAAEIAAAIAMAKT